MFILTVEDEFPISEYLRELFVGRDDSIRCAEMSSSVCLLRCNGNDARRPANESCGAEQEAE
jgi:hypothetical protein